ncbi:uncharacterized protein Z518_01078 [Rhinocladiella mackenziei CBS 650.93]|uniref:Rhinocladiella mackenziei CBS 650.93 unplaced genomic scaffold supercont1.1, whole genome shotgun sequence n=1 Tax=Rhinocladiella mackenziei CBS 650.93 TaxID=1442369 RepID=A0A0D2G5D7_9EURO|nr:uncharacterized protein Z518_01078 [Rhinocladiella mackenziei CBS 650.93]KIX09997.1 hypothetical protein Z518_01078 [Rhinocladiella mackenziei CBS 650.93]
MGRVIGSVESTCSYHHWSGGTQGDLQYGQGRRTEAAQAVESQHHDVEQLEVSAFSRVKAFYSYGWTQIVLISLICFCCPGMYNALTGLGGSGQVDPTVAANATVALLSATARTALFIVGLLFSYTGSRICFLLGGWTYALYSGSLLNFNHHDNGAFVIASGAVLGVGASMLWVVHGAIMTTYVAESQKGRAIAVFWIIFNLGGGVGSLASFGLNFHSQSGTVSDSTYIALMIVMLVSWGLGIFICSPKRIRLAQLHAAVEKEKHSWRGTVEIAVRTMASWRVFCMLPLFFCANVFYSYQQNQVNGMTFNIRTRSLNSALYWIAQMLGGLLIGIILDLPFLHRPMRARVGWLVLFVTGMSIWGGGVRYPRGRFSNSTSRAAILVGAYKTFQATGGAMAWRINAQHKSPMTQLGMNWGLSIGALMIVLPTVWTVTSATIEKLIRDQELEMKIREVEGETVTK